MGFVIYILFGYYYSKKDKFMDIGKGNGRF